MHHAKPQFLSRNAFERSLSYISVSRPHGNVCSHKRDNKKKVFLFNHKIYVANDRFQGNYTEMMTRYKQLLMYIKSAVTRNYSEKSINSILDYISTSKQVRCNKSFLWVFFLVFFRDPLAPGRVVMSLMMSQDLHHKVVGGAKICHYISVSEIKDFSDAHTGCTIPKTMHPANYVCILPYMIYLMLKKDMHFRVHGFKIPCTRQQNLGCRVHP